MSTQSPPRAHAMNNRIDTFHPPTVHPSSFTERKQSERTPHHTQNPSSQVQKNKPSILYFERTYLYTKYSQPTAYLCNRPSFFPFPSPFLFSSSLLLSSPSNIPPRERTSLLVKEQDSRKACNRTTYPITTVTTP